MPRAMRRFLAICFSVIYLTSGITCQADAPLVSAEAYILMDAESGRVLLAHNETQEKSIASTTKIMTALVALECSEPSDKVMVKREHLKEGSSMYLAEGEIVTMEELLYGLLLPSGNDAAECIADTCGGRDAFVAQMNRKAAELGMMHTSFANPSGLDEEGHYSCALDMARLAARAMEDPTFARIVATKTATAGTRTMGNHNKLLGSLDGCVGLKTGYTGDAGRTLVTCAERDGLRLVAVTLHDGSDWTDHTALYEYGFSAYHRQTAVRRAADCAEAAVRGGVETGVRALASESFSYPLAEGEALTTRIDLSESVQAPVKKGQKLGELLILLGEDEVGHVDLVSDRAVPAASVQKAGLAEKIWRLLSK